MVKRLAIRETLFFGSPTPLNYPVTLSNDSQLAQNNNNY
jgi:hypothetical protein